MKTPREIYAAYKIMPSLQLHQLRVAAAAKLICDNFREPINEGDVILTCLFHDMGNIVKSDLSHFPDFTEPEGIEYWERVKADFIAKYGAEQHAANAAIAREIGLSQHIVDMMDASGFSRIEGVLGNASYELKIYQYADMRVGPRGVLPLGGRLAEGRMRYVAPKMDYYDSNEGFQKLLHVAHDIEQQIFTKVAITPENINDASVAPLIEELWEYTVA